jgi:hypothetical protein
MPHKPFDEYIRCDWDYSTFRYEAWFNFLLTTKDLVCYFAENFQSEMKNSNLQIDYEAYSAYSYDDVSNYYKEEKNRENREKAQYHSIYLIDSNTKNIFAYCIIYNDDANKEIEIKHLASINENDAFQDITDKNDSKTSGLGAILLYVVSLYTYFYDINHKYKISLIDSSGGYYDIFGKYGFKKEIASDQQISYISHTINHHKKTIPTSEYFKKKELEVFNLIQIDNLYTINSPYQNINKYKTKYRTHRKKLKQINNTNISILRDSNYIKLNIAFKILKKYKRNITPIKSYQGGVFKIEKYKKSDAIYIRKRDIKERRHKYNNNYIPIDNNYIIKDGNCLYNSILSCLTKDFCWLDSLGQYCWADLHNTIMAKPRLPNVGNFRKKIAEHFDSYWQIIFDPKIVDFFRVNSIFLTKTYKMIKTKKRWSYYVGNTYIEDLGDLIPEVIANYLKIDIYIYNISGEMIQIGKNKSQHPIKIGYNGIDHYFIFN